jgi:hypothetical protein
LTAAIGGDEVEGDLAEKGEVAGGGAIAHPAIIFAADPGCQRIVIPGRTPQICKSVKILLSSG